MSENQTDNYKGVFDNRLGYGQTPALVLIDFVQAYFDPDCELYADVEDTLASALRVRAAARAAGIPIFLTNVTFQADGRDGGKFFQKVKPLRHFIQGSAMGKWPDKLVPEPDEVVVTKQYPSAFFGTSFASTLTTLQIDSLIITGLTTSGCVRATTLDACCHGFTPLVVEEACGDRHAGPHEANMFDMNAKYADVVSEKDVINYLENL